MFKLWLVIFAETVMSLICQLICDIGKLTLRSSSVLKFGYSINVSQTAPASRWVRCIFITWCILAGWIFYCAAYCNSLVCFFCCAWNAVNYLDLYFHRKPKCWCSQCLKESQIDHCHVVTMAKCFSAMQIKLDNQVNAGFCKYEYIYFTFYLIYPYKNLTSLIQWLPCGINLPWQDQKTMLSFIQGCV